MVRTPLKPVAVAEAAVLQRLAVTGNMRHSVFAIAVLRGPAVHPPALVMALEAGGFAVNAAVELRSMAGRTVLVGPAVALGVVAAAEIDRMEILTAAGTGPQLAVAAGASRFMIRSALKIVSVTKNAVLQRLAISEHVRHSTDANIVLGGPAVHPLALVVAFEARGFAVAAAVQLRPVASTAVLVGPAIALGVEVTAEVDRVDVLPATGAGPQLAVACGAGRLAVAASLEGGAVAAGAVGQRLTKARDMVDSPQRDIVAGIVAAG